MRGGGQKLLTIHVYYTTNKFLVHGKSCQQWVEEEFKRLRSVVHTLASFASPDPLSITQLATEPDAATAAAIMTFTEPRAVAEDDTRGVLVPPPATLTQHGEVEPGDLACPLNLSSRLQTTLPSRPPSPSSPNDRTFPPLVQSPPSTLLSLCVPSLTVPVGEDTQSPGTPVNAPSSCQPTAMAPVQLNPVRSLPSHPQTSIDNQDNDASRPPAQHDSTNNNDSTSLPSPHKDTTNDNKDNSTPLPSPPKDTTNDNEENNGVLLSSQQDTREDNDNTTLPPSSRDTTNEDNDKASVTGDMPAVCCHGDCVSRAEFQQTTQSLQAEISALRAALHEARQTFKIELDAITTQLHHLQSTNSKAPLPRSSKHPPNSKATSPKSTHSSKSLIANPATRDGSDDNSSKRTSKPDNTTTSPSSKLLLFSPPPKERNGVIAQPSSAGKPSPSSKPPLLPDPPKEWNGVHVQNKATTADSTTPVSQSLRQQTSTFNHLKHVSVTADTTTILLGDSVVKGVDLFRSSPPNSRPQKVCVSDLTVTQLTEWLSGQTPSPAVRQATVHVGGCDCTENDNAISSEKWKGLLSQCRRVFPKASLLASAILPARGRHPLNAVIHPSNRNLQQVCAAMGVNYKDHTPVFTTSSGAPRMALYKDAILPTRKGTARLSENLFAGKVADSNTVKKTISYRQRPTGPFPPSTSLYHPFTPAPDRPSTQHTGRTQSNSNTPQSSQPERPSSLPHCPTHPHYSEAFPPLPNATITQPQPSRQNTNATQPAAQQTGHSWFPPPPAMMVPPHYPPMFPPHYMRGPPSPPLWHWPPFMPVGFPPSYGHF